jgi:hypothetical protein
MSLLNAGRVSRKRDNGFISEIFRQIAQIVKGVRKIDGVFLCTLRAEE